MTTSNRIESLLRSLTLEEKFILIAGADTWRTHAVPRLGIPALKLSDGPNGVRGEHKDTWRYTSASFPAETAMAATWNPNLVYQLGQALAEEARVKGVHVLLGPTLNIHRHPLAGRNFECFSEDPYLSARMAVAYITGIQSQGVAACAKHFVCNDQEFERFTISAEVDERSLREIYLPPFQAAVQEAGVWVVMTAYNRLNGVYASENAHLILEILKGEWGYDGLVISDWYGTYSENVPAQGLDLEMPGPARWMGEPAREAFRCGALTEEALDDKVRRLLRLIERVRAFDMPSAGEERSVNNPTHRDLIRRVGQEAIVLLKNEDHILPLSPERVRSLAVIGRPARNVAFQGGGSAEVYPHYVVQPLDAIQARYGDRIQIAYAPGPSLHRRMPLLDPAGLRAEDGTPGKVTVRVYANRHLEGDPVDTFLSGGTQLAWFGVKAAGLDFYNFSVRITGSWTPPVSGRYTFSFATVGRARWWFDGQKMHDLWDVEEPQEARPDEDPPVPWREEQVEIELEAGKEYPFQIEFATVPGGRWRTVRLGALPPQPADPIGEAVALAREADVAVVFAGLTPEWESEGFDRESMDLPCGQNELIARVAEANPNTVVVLNTGSPVHMPWLDKVKAVIQMWYLGQEAGNAITDVLFGEADPGGRLPMTFPKRLQDTPAYINYPGENGRVFYGERLFVGYRYYDKREIEPLFPFGHGLSYTTFSFDALELDADMYQRGQPVQVRVAITNTGTRRGHEVVQVYVRDVESALMRPPKELKAFTKVTLDPGETRTVALTLNPDAFAFYDDRRKEWVIEPGEFEVLVGRSAGDIRLRRRFRLV